MSSAGFQRVAELVNPLGGSTPTPPAPPKPAESNKEPGGFLQTLGDFASSVTGCEPKTVLIGVVGFSTLYLAYRLWPSRTDHHHKPKTRSRRASSANRSRSSSRVSFPCSPIPEYYYDSHSEESDQDPPTYRHGFSADPNYTPNSPFKKHRNLDHLVKSKDSQFYALFNYVGASSGPSEVVTIPATSATSPPAERPPGPGFPVEASASASPPPSGTAAVVQRPVSGQPGGGVAPSNVMREIPQNMPQQPSRQYGSPGTAASPPAYAANQKSTLERLKERYRNGELPQSLMKQASVERSLRAVRRMTSGFGKAPQDNNSQLSLDPLPGAAPEPQQLSSHHVRDEDLDIG